MMGWGGGAMKAVMLWNLHSEVQMILVINSVDKQNDSGILPSVFHRTASAERVEKAWVGIRVSERSTLRALLQSERHTSEEDRT